MREKLIELIIQGKSLGNCLKDECTDCFGEHCSECEIGDIADHLLANGVIVSPIKVGQTVWYVDDFTEEIEECKVYGFTVVNGKLSLLVDNGECKFVTRKWCNTKEEAEKALAERKDNDSRKEN